MEADAAGTAHRLALKNRGGGVSALQAWSVLGLRHVGPRRPARGKRTTLAILINYYGRQAGVPEQLTKAMITPASAAASRADRAAEAIALTQAVTKHLAGAP